MVSWFQNGSVKWVFKGEIMRKWGSSIYSLGQLWIKEGAENLAAISVVWLCRAHASGSQLPLIQSCLCVIFVDVTHSMEVPSFLNSATPICHLNKKETSPLSYTKSIDFLFSSRKFSVHFMFDKEHQELILRNHFSLAEFKFIKKLKTNKSLVLSPYLLRAGCFLHLDLITLCLLQ